MSIKIIEQLTSLTVAKQLQHYGFVEWESAVSFYGMQRDSGLTSFYKFS